MSKGKDQKNLPSQKPTDNKPLKSPEASDLMYSLKEVANFTRIDEIEIIRHGTYGDVSIYIKPPTGIDAVVGKNDLYVFLANPQTSIKLLELKDTYKEYLLGIEESFTNARKYYAGLCGGSCPDSVYTRYHEYESDAKYYDITTHSFLIYECDLELFKEQLDDSYNTEDDNNTKQSIFMDKQNDTLYLENKKPVKLRPKEMKLVNYMRSTNGFRLEEILSDHFKQKSTEYDRRIFDTYKSLINKKCQSLGMGDLIEVHESKMKAFKLSVHITKKTLQL